MQSGLIDPELAAALGRTETLRLRADCTGNPINAKTAADTLALAENFLASVSREFVLHEPGTPKGLESNHPDRRDEISVPGDTGAQSESNYPRGRALSVEEVRRQARENWLRLRQQKRQEASDAGHNLGHEQEL